MLYGKRIAVVLPAYNAARTLEKTVAEIPADVVDTILLVDDSSKDETIEIAHRLGLQVFPHEQNYGYGRNQKTCYSEALHLDADVVVMLHPDYQYQPRLVLPMAALIFPGNAMSFLHRGFSEGKRSAEVCRATSIWQTAS